MRAVLAVSTPRMLTHSVITPLTPPSSSGCRNRLIILPHSHPTPRHWHAHAHAHKYLLRAAGLRAKLGRERERHAGVDGALAEAEARGGARLPTKERERMKGNQGARTRSSPVAVTHPNNPNNQNEVTHARAVRPSRAPRERE